MIKLLILAGILFALLRFFNRSDRNGGGGQLKQNRSDTGQSNVEDAVWKDVS